MSAQENDGRFARRAWLRALERTARIEREGVPLALELERLAPARAQEPALIMGAQSLTWQAFVSRMRRYSRFALEGLEPGDTVALVMNNRPEYLCAWLGITRVGVATALINPQLRGDALRHSLAAVRPKRIIVDAPNAAALVALGTALEGVELWLSEPVSAATAPAVAAGPGAERPDPAGSGPAAVAAGPEAGAPGMRALSRALDQCDASTLGPREERAPPLDATALYIYTSGTTGLPKAARVSHYRVLQWSHWFAGLMETRPEDRMYDCLPLYHSVGGVVATGATLLGGGAVVVRERFSASEFWNEVRREGCTLFQYIGELCRYLVNAPAHPQETDHRLRLACGNGLRADVWPRFVERFRIPRVLEYYASTEGNFSLYNCEGEVGAIGRIPPFLSGRLPVALVRFDVERGEPLRNARGFCEPCAVDEPGEALGRIPEDGRVGRFEGYADAAASERKLLRDVFEAGDRWYRTGDLMRRDARGFFYFVDRIGDTFRWKGENVSTAEVVAALAGCRGVREAVVYGVEVPGADGRAGMAALVTQAPFDVRELALELARRLPMYARPVFLRLLTDIALTGTFKPQTRALAEAGFDPRRIGDPLFMLDARADTYLPLDAARYAAIIAGEVRL